MALHPIGKLLLCVGAGLRKTCAQARKFSVGAAFHAIGGLPAAIISAHAIGDTGYPGCCAAPRRAAFPTGKIHAVSTFGLHTFREALPKRFLAALAFLRANLPAVQTGQRTCLCAATEGGEATGGEASVYTLRIGIRDRVEPASAILGVRSGAQRSAKALLAKKARATIQI